MDGWESAACVLWLFTESALRLTMKERTRERKKEALCLWDAFSCPFACESIKSREESERREEGEKEISPKDPVVNPFLSSLVVDFLFFSTASSLRPSSFLPSFRPFPQLFGQRTKVKTARVHLSIHVTSFGQSMNR